jgi:hypothetical protein
MDRGEERKKKHYKKYKKGGSKRCKRNSRILK